jgi:hypothetical protein
MSINLALCVSAASIAAMVCIALGRKAPKFCPAGAAIRDYRYLRLTIPSAGGRWVTRLNSLSGGAVLERNRKNGAY